MISSHSESSPLIPPFPHEKRKTKNEKRKTKNEKRKKRKKNDNREYVKAGTYLLLEKLRPAVARRLVRKVAALHAAASAASGGGAGGAAAAAPGGGAALTAHQLPLAKVAAALEWSGAPSDPDAVECLVARLIYRRLIKGYIAHKAGVLVLSKTDPFPSLEAVSLADPL